MSESQSKTLAERCYDQGIADEELFHKIHYILGGAPLDGCAEPGFKWPCGDSWTDHYDGSVEIYLTESAPEFTQDHANQILAFGFHQIYVSRQGKNGPKDGENWTTKGKSWCSPRERGEERVELVKARIELTATRARLAELEGIAERLCFRLGCGCGGDYGHCETCRTVINELEAYKERKK